MISFQERKERIINTTHIVLIDDSTVYVVDSVEQIGNIVFVNVGNGLLFQDMMVLTLEEAGIAAKLILNINKYLDIK
jgi:predicted phosphatase